MWLLTIMQKRPNMVVSYGFTIESRHNNYASIYCHSYSHNRYTYKPADTSRNRIARSQTECSNDDASLDSHSEDVALLSLATVSALTTLTTARFSSSNYARIRFANLKISVGQYLVNNEAAQGVRMLGGITFLGCDPASHLALPHYCQPYTVFTYCDREGVKKSMDNESSSVIASKLFQRIEYTVIKSPSEASIKKDLVVSFMANATMIAKSRIFLLI
ncbi:hypothetical protein PHYBLDRAFT_147621 [Phycomyces blakesleeanus NRRL 1555(-)]|uniref:Uncharacterized protein n=1 Tax=Phycomyces blakesleeanus (strain ATCC 8743b / DSM 1359 / FGSC 10004 / NBRC 33097 / NRRL 1555) TaxID=763407 RepID=A0A163A4Y2_PHYB8|nr:hypothetical protein PHYBLDRAFT_147621 [Phycomyces blakesleeanus NRRL 1555(-)]OAD71111.1 hypothetical protein PHYBLDRAFT_147621 [Phycomyces blakesleeanus NRRL 1555(-)]|eukprot:XP_018289151.1 hypothetical protein PHYBLDRAFT_147621 [Phycomyces blakesleeanus NRRL 1555(-)]